jgi:Uncharacterized conserved protein (DUF2190)
MAAPREGDLPTFCYHHFTVSLPASTPALVAGTPIGFNLVPVTNPATPVFGITEFDIAAGGGDVTISLAGIVQVITGGGNNVGDAMCFDGTSRAVATGPGNQLFGRALNAATAAGQRIRILITREGTN